MKVRAIAITAIMTAVLTGGVLGLYERSAAAPLSDGPLPPFAETVKRQIDVITKLDEVVAQLKEQNKLLKEQNAILKSGKLTVVVKK